MTRFDYDVRHPRAIFRLWVLRSMAGSALLAGSAFAVVHAQDPAGHTSAGIEEVVVTASKRGEQNVQDVSMSIAAFDEASLRARGADNFLDYARAVPGLSVQDQGPGDKKYVIRGVQSVGAATTGLYFDEIVMTANNRQDGGGRQPDLKLFDIERVEVLRGPQGTLYGASSMSGTIRIVANKPDASEFAGAAELEACMERLLAAGYAVEEDDLRAKERGVLRLCCVADPSGHPVELVAGRTLAYAQFLSPAGVSGFVTGESGNMGFGHAVLAASDVEQSRRFWIDLIGFRLTDTMHFELAPGAPSKALYFLHADNPRHHSIALIEFPVPGGLVHFMVEANDIDDVGRFIDRCERDNVHIATRLGRHSNDRMISVYAVTPGGSMIEFGCDGLQIDWRNWVATNSLIPDLWGHKPPPGGPPTA